MRILKKSETGAALPIVVAASCIVILLGVSLLKLAESERVLTHQSIKKTQAFHLAEAGVARFVANAYNGTVEEMDMTSLGDGSYQVDTYFDASPPYAISTGTVGNVQKRIKVEVSFLSAPYEHAIYSCNSSRQEWTLDLRGLGASDSGGSRDTWGGWGSGWTWSRRQSSSSEDEQDIINGDIYVNGNVAMYGDSNVNPVPDPNPHGLNGDVIATGNVDLYDDASISGDVQEGAEKCDVPDLPAMEYEVNNTHHVSQIFTDEGISYGHLSGDHELYNVIQKNPTDRSSECSATKGDDYFLEPAQVTGGGDETSATTPLNLGRGRVYYVDGNVWIHHKSTFGFLLEGNATIVATGNIYICDNTEYADDETLLGLVALGEYDDGGNLVSGGNIYFGYPRYGTMYTVSALMFAGNDFLYNTDSVTGQAGEPESGFSVYGNFAAMNQVSIHRDWYDTDGDFSYRHRNGKKSEARPAYYDPDTDQWIDMEDGSMLSSSEIKTLRHYPMKVDYDARVRDIGTQPAG
ncbi:MAG: hypothetical protein JXM79_01985, partial [Sedimentisphaerales bacterium]|nr:hypothetical protein [Sedimentisphaerales bacterium]